MTETTTAAPNGSTNHTVTGVGLAEALGLISHDCTLQQALDALRGAWCGLYDLTSEIGLAVEQLELIIERKEVS
jgi:hypothetical protein